MDATYFDVSGSIPPQAIYDYTYKECGSDCIEYDLPTHYFNTEVSDSKHLPRGGTDFRAVYKHALERGYTHICIVTDIYCEYSVDAQPRELNIDWIILQWPR